jgi:hypothetical protein
MVVEHVPRPKVRAPPGVLKIAVMVLLVVRAKEQADVPLQPDADPVPLHPAKAEPVFAAPWQLTFVPLA